MVSIIQMKRILHHKTLPYGTRLNKSPEYHKGVFSIFIDIFMSKFEIFNASTNMLKMDQATVIYETTDPSLISSSGPTATKFPLSSDAHKTIPSDKIPRSLTGFKLVTTTTFLPINSSGV